MISPCFPNHTAVDLAFCLGCSHGCNFLFPYSAPLPIHLHSFVCHSLHVWDLSPKPLLFLLPRFSLWLPSWLNISTVTVKAIHTAYLLCFSPQIPALRKCFYFANRETEAHLLKLFARDCTAWQWTARYRLEPHLLTSPSNALVFRHELENKLAELKRV